VSAKRNFSKQIIKPLILEITTKAFQNRRRIFWPDLRKYMETAVIEETEFRRTKAGQKATKLNFLQRNSFP